MLQYISACFTIEPVLYKHTLIVWLLNISTVLVLVYQLNSMAETTRNTLNQLKHHHARLICKKSYSAIVYQLCPLCYCVLCCTRGSVLLAYTAQYHLQWLVIVAAVSECSLCIMLSVKRKFVVQYSMIITAMHLVKIWQDI